MLWITEDITQIPFELTLNAQESLAYGTYYSIDLRRTDIKPQLTLTGENIQNQEIEAPKTARPLLLSCTSATEPDPASESLIPVKIL